METYKTKEPIDVIRTETVAALDIRIGDRIAVDHYTATCQEITPNGALFLLDQYLDKDSPMNRKNTNEGGYEKSDLRKKLNSEEVLEIFGGLRERMVPFENGDLLRIPFHGELFGEEDDSCSEPASCFEPDGCRQWPLMKDRKNRIAFRQSRWEWGWLQNRLKDSVENFCRVARRGYAYAASTSDSGGVRPVFLIGR